MSSELLHRRRLMMTKPSGGGVLPAEYQQVEYLENAPGAYINTGYVANGNTKVELEFLTKSGTGFLFGARKSVKELTFYLYYTRTYTRFAYGKINLPMVEMSVVISTGIKHNLIMDRGVSILDGVTYTNNATQSFTGYEIFLFAYNQAGTSKEGEKQQNYYVKIWDDDVLVREMYPCYRKLDQEAGMYDIVNGVFYTNAGRGSFVVGADV